MNTVFHYSSYKDYLKDWLNENHYRGIKKRLAQAMSCQESYLTKVFNATHHFSEDQLMGGCKFIGLDDTQSHFLLTLLRHERASLPDLREMIMGQLNKMRAESEKLSNRLDQREISDLKSCTVYYANWMLSAVHILTDCQKYQRVESLSERLELPKDVIVQILYELVQLKLIEKRDNRYKIVSGSIHLPEDSPMITHHHNNWHQRALLDCTNKRSDGLHYTVVQSHSVELFYQLKEQLREWIASVKVRVQDSPPENAYCLKLNLFEV